MSPRARVTALLERLRPRAGTYSGEVVQSFLTNVTLAGLALVSGVLLARGLGPDGRGRLAAIQAVPLLLGSMGMLGLQDAIIYFGARDRERAGRYAVSSTALLLLLSLPIVLLGYLALPWYRDWQSVETLFASRIYLAIFYFNVLFGLAIFTSRAVHDIGLWNRLRLMPAVLWVGVILALMALDRLSPRAVAFVYLGTLFPLCGLAILPVRRHLAGHWRVERALWPRLLRYGLPLAAGASPQILNERIDTLIVIGALPSAEAGFYAVAVSWSALMRLPGEALIAVSFSRIAGIADPGEQRRVIARSTGAVIVASAAFGVALAAAAPLALPLVFGTDFHPAVAAAVILVLAAALRNVARMLQTAMQSVGRPSAVLVSEWTGLGVLAVAMALLLPRYGLSGAAWSSVAASGASTVSAYAILANWKRDR